jgi:metal-dependent hydrolase (beta-lactamase superfamily II)
VITRLHLGSILRPGSETPDGSVRAEAIYAYLVRHDDGPILFDTGIGADPDVDEHYRPTRYALPEALSRAGLTLDDVSVVANCHLHFDHCGGNPLLPGRPVFVQRRELDTARTTEYTLPSLVDYGGAAYEELDGEAEIRPGVWILPTPGHVDGHQSLVVRRPDGTVVLAGQAHDFASEFSHSVMARSARLDGAAQGSWQAPTKVVPNVGSGTAATPLPGPQLPAYPAWLDRILEFDPRRVLFAHDAAVWEPPA